METVAVCLHNLTDTNKLEKECGIFVTGQIKVQSTMAQIFLTSCDCTKKLPMIKVQKSYPYN